MAQKTISAKAGSSAVQSSVDTFANTRNASSGSTSNYIVQTAFNGSSYQMSRCFLNFATTTIPQGSKVTAATLVHPVVANFLNQDSVTLYVVDHTASDPVVGGDYDQVTLNSDTTYAGSLFSALSTVATTNISLDSNGIALIQTAVNARTNIKLALRSSLDTANSAPSGYNEYTATATDFQLIVTYSPAGGAALFAAI